VPYDCSSGQNVRTFCHLALGALIKNYFFALIFFSPNMDEENSFSFWSAGLKAIAYHSKQDLVGVEFDQSEDDY
jgi:hypothetical protein